MLNVFQPPASSALTSAPTSTRLPIQASAAPLTRTRQGSNAPALANDDDRLALAGLVFEQATVLAMVPDVRWLHVTAKMRAIRTGPRSESSIHHAMTTSGALASRLAPVPDCATRRRDRSLWRISASSGPVGQRTIALLAALKFGRARAPSAGFRAGSGCRAREARSHGRPRWRRPRSCRHCRARRHP